MDGSCLGATAVPLTDEFYTLYVASAVTDTEATNPSIDTNVSLTGISVNGAEIKVFNEEYIDYKSDYQGCIRYF